MGPVGAAAVRLPMGRISPSSYGQRSRANQAVAILVWLGLRHEAAVQAAPCTAGGMCTDSTGEKWQLGLIGGEFTIDGPTDPTYQYQYVFSLYQNLNPVPDICQTFSVLGTNSARYDSSSFGTCEQLGPDMNVAPQYTLKRTGKTLVFVYGYSGNSLTINLNCNFNAGKGTPSAVTGASPNFVVNWDTNYACTGGAAQGGSEGGSAWGLWFLIIFGVGTILYAGGGMYYNSKTQGTMSHPHARGWVLLPGLVKDGMQFAKYMYDDRYGGGAAPREKPSWPTDSGEQEPLAYTPGGPAASMAAYGTMVSPVANGGESVGALRSSDASEEGTPRSKKKVRKVKNSGGAAASPLPSPSPTDESGGEGTPVSEKKRKKRKKKKPMALEDSVDAKE